MSENYKEDRDEIPEQPIKYEDIERQLDRSGVLGTMDKRAPNLFLAILRGEITEEDANLYERSTPEMGSRGSDHAYRMLQRPGAEKEFAIAYCTYNAESLFTEDEIDLKDRIRRVIQGEGSDTMLFWTFAPYIFKVLKEKGTKEDGAMRMILEWGGTGKSFASVRAGEYINLRGLEFLNQYQGAAYILRRGPHHVSHQYTEQEARRIADILLLGS